MRNLGKKISDIEFKVAIIAFYHFCLMIAVPVMLYDVVFQTDMYEDGIVYAYLHPVIKLLYCNPSTTSMLVSMIFIIKAKNKDYSSVPELGKYLFFLLLSANLISKLIISPHMFFKPYLFLPAILLFIVIRSIYIWNFKYKYHILVVFGILFMILSSETYGSLLNMLAFALANLHTPESDSGPIMEPKYTHDSTGNSLDYPSPYLYSIRVSGEADKNLI